MAGRLMLKLIRRAMLRGETSFLHVLSDNLSAQRLYRAMGFSDHCEVAGHVIMRD
jgi:predicted GNAT family acetyltransferase